MGTNINLAELAAMLQTLQRLHATTRASKETPGPPGATTTAVAATTPAEQRNTNCTNRLSNNIDAMQAAQQQN